MGNISKSSSTQVVRYTCLVQQNCRYLKMRLPLSRLNLWKNTAKKAVKLGALLNKRLEHNFELPLATARGSSIKKRAVAIPSITILGGVYICFHYSFLLSLLEA